ncbi:MAG: thiol reductant ABC exporter subunit CydC [Acidimicrobiales bacterium]|nr:thiol reductant ABC exporter subunit CydC [Acidimicrobiales bacterium]
MSARRGDGAPPTGARQARSAPAVLRRLVRLAGVPRARLALAVALGVASVACSAGLLATSGYLISRAAEQPPILSLFVTIVLVRAFGLARPLARYLERLATHDLAFRVLGRIRVRVWERIEPLAPVGLPPLRRGELLARFVGDVDDLQQLYLRGLAPPLVALVVTLGASAVAAAFLPAAGAVLLAGMALTAAAVAAVAAPLGRRPGRAQAPLRAALTAELVESLQGAPELAVYGREDEAIRRVRDSDAELGALARRGAWASGLADGVLLLGAGATTVAVLAVAVAGAAAGDLDRTRVALLALLALGAFEALVPLPAAALAMAGCVTSGRRLLPLLDAEPAVTDPPDPRPAPPPRPAAALDAVAARYPTPPDEDATVAPPLVLDHADLAVAPGDQVALTGRSGAGKTTVVTLLLRFLDPVDGAVRLADRDLRELRQHDVRRAVAVAGQDAHVFTSTIRANLALARPDATDAQLTDALRRARLGDWVAALPDGLDTFVGEGGDALSGGQRQRLTIARALLTDAGVLVLDEPTAHLDPATAEALVAGALDAARADGRSVLLVTHRSEGLALVDRILELRGGRIGPAPRAHGREGADRPASTSGV